MAQFLPADHTKGDANTIGGYMAVHARPAAFEGSDGVSYSVEIVTDTSGRHDLPFGAYLLFVKWHPGNPVAGGHLETDFLSFARSESEARSVVGAMSLNDVKAQLDLLIKARAGSERRWWEVMHDEDPA